MPLRVTVGVDYVKEQLQDIHIAYDYLVYYSVKISPLAIMCEFVKGLMLSCASNIISINKRVGLCNWKWSVHTLEQ